MKNFQEKFPSDQRGTLDPNRLELRVDFRGGQENIHNNLPSPLRASILIMYGSVFFSCQIVAMFA
jgi:hypothetical protein